MPTPASPDSFFTDNLDWATRLSQALVKDGFSADDLLQRTLLAGLENPPPKDHPNRRGWLKVVMGNQRRMTARGEGRRRAREAKVSGGNRVEKDRHWAGDDGTFRLKTVPYQAGMQIAYYTHLGKEIHRQEIHMSDLDNGFLQLDFE